MAETILVRSSSEQFKEDYTRYGIYVLYRRVLSDFRDGLKPVQRRVIWAMYKNSGAVNHTVKSMAVIGDVMKYYHPHGDVSIYGAIKTMTNWFECKVPLIEKQGSFGNFQGDEASAARYTECKLSKFAQDVLISDIDSSNESVDWRLNYSNTVKEPDFLPAKIPLLLVNGSMGIGVGLKSDIPAHNLSEVIDATIMLMMNPDADVVLVPDHCMKCDIYNTDFAQICKTGYGHYKIRGKIEIEEYKHKTALVITSVPDLTFLNIISDKIDELVANKKLVQIENAFDESDAQHMRYVIVLKNGADPNYVRDVIYKNTKMEQNLRINFETLNGLNPMRLSYKSYLMSFIDFRKITKFRVHTNRLQNVQTKIHEREAYIKVLESGEIDTIINMIRKQKTVDDTALIEYLIKKLKITDLQASYIINADIKKLSLGYLAKYKEEAKALEEIRKELMHKLTDNACIEKEIMDELLYIKQKYGKPRTCRIVKETNMSDIPKGEMIVAITEKNFIRKVPGGTNIGNFRNDNVKSIINLDNTDSIMIFDDQGRVFRLPVHRIPFTDKSSNGTDIRFIMKGLTSNINSIIPESIIKNLSTKGVHDNKHYLITITKSGLFKRMDLDDFVNVPPSGILYAKVDPGDYIQDILIAHSEFNIVIYSDRKAISVKVNDIPYLKRNTKGSKSMYNTDYIDGFCIVNKVSTDIVIITNTGRVNRMPVTAFPTDKRSSKSGSNVIKLGTGDIINAILSVNDSNIVCVKTLNNYYEIPVSQIKAGSSISSGDKMVNTRGDQIIHCYLK